MYQEIDLLELLNKRKEREEKAAELRKQAEAEVSLVNQKHKQILDEYSLAYDELQRMQMDFHKEWDPLLADYDKEMKAINAKYKRMAKSL